MCNIAQEASGNIAQEKIFFNDALKYSRVNIAQVDTLHDVALEAPDKNAQGKILFNDALILLEQHYVGKDLVQCSPRGSRKHCT